MSQYTSRIILIFFGTQCQFHTRVLIYVTINITSYYYYYYYYYYFGYIIVMDETTKFIPYTCVCVS
jgi:hypothetical protein